MPWTEPSASRQLGESHSVELVHFWAWLLSLSGGIALARRNWKRGSGDRRTAARLAVVIALWDLAVALLGVNHTGDLLLERRLLVQGLSLALFDGGTAWVIYLALEPYVRRIWPDHLVSWSRLLAGRWRDPLVARDLMAGLGAGVLGTLASFAQAWGGVHLGAPGALPVIRNFPDSAGLRTAVAQLGIAASDGVGAGFILFFALVALRFLVRRNWIAYVLLVPLLVFGNQFANPTGLPVLDWAASLSFAALFLLLGARFGILAVAAMVATMNFLTAIPLTAEWSVWYAGQTIFAALLVGGLTLAAARFATGRRMQLS
jgi:hypothetical protein